jgi:hypothetical protein
MASTRFWIEGMEQASPHGRVDGQIAIVTPAKNPEFLLTNHLDEANE